jgi:hypothetical protein
MLIFNSSLRADGLLPRLGGEYKSNHAAHGFDKSPNQLNP